VSGLLDLLNSVGGAVGGATGAAGTAISALVLRKTLGTSEESGAAKKQAESAVAKADTAQAGITKLTELFDALRRGMRMELDEFKESFRRASSPAFPEEETRRTIEGLRNEIANLRAELGDIDVLRSELSHEREQRVALQDAISDSMKGDAEKWSRLNVALTRLETQIEERTSPGRTLPGRRG